MFFQAYSRQKDDLPSVKTYYKVRTSEDIITVIKIQHRTDFDIVYPGETLAFTAAEILKEERKDKPYKRVAADDLDGPTKKIQNHAERFLI